MSIAKNAVDDYLEDWDEIKDEFQRAESGILLGNGASRAVWDHFRYDSLYELACLDDGYGNLDAADRRLFDEMGTRNFEAVLSALKTSKLVCSILSEDTWEIERRYDSIREALIHAIRGVHLPYDRLTPETKAAISSELKLYDYVYTTNYDLVYYWSMMSLEDRFKDYLWFGGFDPTNTVVWGEATKVLYLHGALHLYRDGEGRTKKRGRETDRGSILRQIEDDREAVPLFISEGTSADKMASIRRNEYLWFAYEKLVKHPGKLVIFGHSMTPEFDQHILDALDRGEKRNYWIDIRKKQTHASRRVAISMRPAESRRIIHEKARLLQALPNLDLVFFDAASHPLGDPWLKVDE